MKLSAVIFDFDGTVVDNEGDWETAFKAVISNNKLQIPNLFVQPNGWVHEPGAGLISNWKRIAKEANEGEIDKYVRETVAEYQKVSVSVRVREGIDAVIEKAKELGMETGLATSNAWYVVEKELEELQLYLAFDVTTTGEEVLLGKPDPEIYLLTAQKLNVEPSECLVIEDSIAGVRSAVEAGCWVVGIVSDYAPRELLLAAGASEVVEQMSDCVQLLV